MHAKLDKQIIRRRPLVINRNQDIKNNIGSSVAAMFTVLTVIAIIAFSIFWYKDHYMDYTSINRIYELQRGQNKFDDYSQEIQVKDETSIYYKVERDRILLYYGRQLITLPRNLINDKDEKLMTSLDAIGIKVDHRVVEKEHQYRITYWGKPVRAIVTGDLGA